MIKHNFIMYRWLWVLCNTLMFQINRWVFHHVEQVGCRFDSNLYILLLFWICRTQFFFQIFKLLVFQDPCEDNTSDVSIVCCLVIRNWVLFSWLLLLLFLFFRFLVFWFFFFFIVGICFRFLGFLFRWLSLSWSCCLNRNCWF